MGSTKLRQAHLARDKLRASSGGTDVCFFVPYSFTEKVLTSLAYQTALSRNAVVDITKPRQASTFTPHWNLPTGGATPNWGYADCG